MFLKTQNLNDLSNFNLSLTKTKLKMFVNILKNLLKFYNQINYYYPKNIGINVTKKNIISTNKLFF